MGHNDSRIIANWFIQRARRDGQRALTNMQLQKLVYFAHGWSLALHHEPMIRDEVQAWEFGPVIPKLYSALAKWGSEPIQSEIGISQEAIDPYDFEILEQVYDAYAKYPASTLSALTHRKGTPWEQVFEPGRKGLRIENDVIADHFSELATR